MKIFLHIFIGILTVSAVGMLLAQSAKTVAAQPAGQEEIIVESLRRIVVRLETLEKAGNVKVPDDLMVIVQAQATVTP